MTIDRAGFNIDLGKRLPYRSSMENINAVQATEEINMSSIDIYTYRVFDAIPERVKIHSTPSGMVIASVFVDGMALISGIGETLGCAFMNLANEYQTLMLGVRCAKYISIERANAA